MLVKDDPRLAKEFVIRVQIIEVRDELDKLIKYKIDYDVPDGKPITYPEKLEVHDLSAIPILVERTNPVYANIHLPNCNYIRR